MDWKKLCDDVAQWAEAHRDEFVKDISDVCRIRSTSHNQLDCTNAPFGQACRDMLDKALEMSSAYGFETRNYDNFCGSAVYGDNPDNDSIGIVAHMDIVPENMCNLANDAGGWTHDPLIRSSRKMANISLPAVPVTTNPAGLWRCTPCGT